MHPDHTHVPIFPGPPPPLGNSPRKEKYQVQSVLPIYSLGRDHGGLLVLRNLKPKQTLLYVAFGHGVLFQ